jgi:hypothetical protein
MEQPRAVYRLDASPTLGLPTFSLDYSGFPLRLPWHRRLLARLRRLWQALLLLLRS